MRHFGNESGRTAQSTGERKEGADTESERSGGGDGDELTLEDTIASDENLEEDCISRLDRERMKRELWIAVDSLPVDQAQTIRCRYMDGLTLKEIGEQQGISADKVRNISDKALRTLRAPRHSRKFRAYYEQYLSATPIHHIGMKSFQNTWMSEVERDVLRNVKV